MSNIYSVDFESGSTQYAEIADGDQTGLDITGNLSTQLWLKPESSVAAARLVSKDDATGQKGYSVSLLDTNKISVFIFQDAVGADSSNAVTTGVVADSAWKHVCVTYTASTGQIVVYFDGGSAEALDTDTTNATAINDNSEDFTIAANTDGGNLYDGRMDEVRVWNKVLTEAENANNYKRQINPNTANLVVYWRFENNLLDMTTNNNDLTATGTPTYSSSDVPFRGSSGMTMVM